MAVKKDLMKYCFIFTVLLTISGCLITKKKSSLKEKNEYFIDNRDGQKYKIVEIGNQVWMAENLRYNSEYSYITKDSNYLYTWLAVMELGYKYKNENWGQGSIFHQGICPEGWHIPSQTEWDTLVTFYEKLEQEKETLRFNSFNLKPTGYLDTSSEQLYEKESVFKIWTRTEDDYKEEIYCGDCEHWGDPKKYYTVKGGAGISAYVYFKPDSSIHYSSTEAIHKTNWKIACRCVKN